PALHDRQHAADLGRDERAGYERATELLEQDDEVEEAEARTAVLIGDQQSLPALFRHLLPQLWRVSLLVLLHLAHERLRALLFEEVARGVLQQLLFFRQSQVHLLSAFLSTAVPDATIRLALSHRCLARSPAVVRRSGDVARLISGALYCSSLFTSS